MPATEAFPSPTFPTASLGRHAHGARRLACAALLLALSATHASRAQHADGVAELVPDAEILLWEQHWTLRADGATEFEERKHVRLNSDRAYGEFADPKIVYDPRCQTVELLAARTIMRDGTKLEPPPYSRIEVSPPGPSGWPEFAPLRQKVFVMSGIEPGCVVEFEYRIRTQPGARPALAADVRVDHRYPVAARAISVTVPAETRLAFRARSATGGEIAPASESQAGQTTYRWRLSDLPAAPDSPQCLPWTRRCPRVSFTTEAGVAAWLNRRLSTVESAVDESPLTTNLAQEWTKDASSDDERMRALQEKLAATFNFVNFAEDWQPVQPRRGSQVLEDNYGLPRESAAALIALCRAAGIAAQPAVLVSDDVWDDATAQDAYVLADVVVRSTPAGPEIWHPQRGRVTRGASFNGVTVLAHDGHPANRLRLAAYENPGESRAELDGTLTLAEDGKFTGELTLRLSGFFVAEDALRTRDAQRSRVQSLIGRVIPGVSVDDFTVRALAPEVFEVDAKVKSAKPIEKVGDYQRLQLGESLALDDAPLPLAYTRLPQNVRLAGAFSERWDLRLRWPKGWKAEAIPAVADAVELSWGAAGQSVQRTDDGLRVERHIRIDRRELSPDLLFEARGPLNVLRGAAARTLLLRS